MHLATVSPAYLVSSDLSRKRHFGTFGISEGFVAIYRFTLIHFARLGATDLGDGASVARCLRAKGVANNGRFRDILGHSGHGPVRSVVAGGSVIRSFGGFTGPRIAGTFWGIEGPATYGANAWHGHESA